MRNAAIALALLPWITLCGVRGQDGSPSPVPGEGSSPARAINDPDGYAWALFAELNQPAGMNDGRVLWETWKNAVDDRQVFLPDGSKPPAWAPAPARTNKDLESLPLQVRVIRERQGLPVPLFDPNVGEGNEVRMNRAAFEFIVAHELYNKEGQLAFFSTSNRGFPIEAKEIKAQWRRLQLGQDPQRFHTTTVTLANGKEETWGLTSLHVTTKDLPNWFWATFEHVDNPGRETQVPSRDSHGVPESLRGTKWGNYVLRGTQVDFTTSSGRATILASSQIEQPFQTTSSCITCHARATIGRGTNDTFVEMDIFESFVPLRGSIGSPRPEWFGDQLHQTDFVWSLSRAARKQ